MSASSSSPLSRSPASVPRPSPPASGLRPAARRMPPPLPAKRIAADASERDALTAARVCLDEIAKLVPCRVSLIHWLDIVRRDFVVAYACGDAAEAMVLERSSYDDPLLRIAMQRAEPFAWGDLRKAPVARLARFSEVGVVTTVLVCPILAGPRQLGAIELVDPLDAPRFRTNDIANIARFAARSMAR